MAAGALIEEGCLIDRDDSGHDRMDDLRVGRETLLSLLEKRRNAAKKQAPQKGACFFLQVL